MSIEDTPEPVRVILERIRRRVETLLSHSSTEVTAGATSSM